MLHKDLSGADLHEAKLHAVTHLAGGTDPLGLAESEITDLVADLTDKVETGDGRLSDARVASDVSAWAKAGTKPTYASSEITNISAAGQALIDDADTAAQRATLGVPAYSEGTWTPVLSGFTVVGAAPAAEGLYRRIGNLVFVSCAISSGEGGNTSIAGAGSISGLPYSVIGISIGLCLSGWSEDLGLAKLAGTTVNPVSLPASGHGCYITGSYCC